MSTVSTVVSGCWKGESHLIIFLYCIDQQEQGMSGGQQNKDEEVLKMVARMNELKEKQDDQVHH